MPGPGREAGDHHVDPYDLEEVERVLREELAADEPSVVIAKAPCVLQFKIKRPVYQVDAELCTGCKRCLQVGCMALNLLERRRGRTQGGDRPDAVHRLRGLRPDVQARRHRPPARRPKGREGLMTARPTTNMLLSGVGGQGVVLASYVLSQVAMAEGYDVKQSEVHGMSQRGGSVTSHFRFGDKVWSPLVTPGTADILLSFEALEALRYVHWLKPGGLLVYNTLRINPSPVSSGLADLPRRDRRAHSGRLAACAVRRRHRIGDAGGHGEGGQRGDAGRGVAGASLRRRHLGSGDPPGGAAQDRGCQPGSLPARRGDCCRPAASCSTGAA